MNEFELHFFFAMHFGHYRTTQWFPLLPPELSDGLDANASDVQELITSALDGVRLKMLETPRGDWWKVQEETYDNVVDALRNLPKTGRRVLTR